MTLQELLPGVIATRDTIEGHINLSQQIVYVIILFIFYLHDAPE